MVEEVVLEVVEVVEVEAVEVGGRRGFGSFSPRLAKHSAGSTL